MTHFVSKVYGQNEYGDEEPNLFAIELTKKRLSDFKQLCIQAQKQRQLHKRFFKGVYTYVGYFLKVEDEDEFLNGEEYAFVETIPNIEEPAHVRGRKVYIYPDNTITFTAYHKWFGNDYDSVDIALDDLMKGATSNSQMEVTAKYKVYEYGQDWVVYDADADKEICVCSEFENEDESPEERARAIADVLNLKDALEKPDET